MPWPWWPPNNSPHLLTTLAAFNSKEEDCDQRSYCRPKELALKSSRCLYEYLIDMEWPGKRSKGPVHRMSEVKRLCYPIAPWKVERPRSCGLYKRTAQTIYCPKATKSLYLPKTLLLMFSPSSTAQARAAPQQIPMPSMACASKYGLISSSFGHSLAGSWQDSSPNPESYWCQTHEMQAMPLWYE